MLAHKHCQFTCIDSMSTPPTTHKLTVNFRFMGGKRLGGYIAVATQMVGEPVKFSGVGRSQITSICELQMNRIASSHEEIESHSAWFIRTVVA